MGHVIDLFMWGYQSHFRIGLELFAKRVFEDAGLTVDVEVLLVGVKDPSATGHPVCVEPEGAAWPVDLFKNLEQRIAELLALDPRKNMIFGDGPSNRDKPLWMRATAARSATAERLLEHDRERGVRSFIGGATRVETYLVLPIIQVGIPQLAGVPSLRRASRGGSVVCTSFVEALADELLSQAARELAMPEPGRSLTRTFERDSRDVLRAAGRTLMYTPERATGKLALGALFDGCNQISALRYEGSAGSGRMIVARVGHPAVHISLAFERPVPIRAATWARKVLQMGSATVALICDGTSIYGLGHLCDAYDPTEEDAFIVDFVAHYTWELRHANSVLLRVAYDEPRLPSPRITEEAVRTLVRRVFGDGDAVDPARIWALVIGAIEQKHGTLLVVSERAPDEARRLAAQGTPVKPSYLSEALIERVTGIDGAVLVDTSGKCHGIGMILDGIATGDGDPARGARFNSAKRYVSTAKAKTVALVVSEDGQVNALPALRPQISRAIIERHVARLTQLSGDINSDWHKERNWLAEHRFYLNAMQCSAVNIALDSLQARTQDEVGRVWIVTEPFAPDAEMNDSYLIPGE